MRILKTSGRVKHSLGHRPFRVSSRIVLCLEINVMGSNRKLVDLTTICVFECFAVYVVSCLSAKNKKIFQPMWRCLYANFTCIQPDMLVCTACVGSLRLGYDGGAVRWLDDCLVQVFKWRTLEQCVRSWIALHGAAELWSSIRLPRDMGCASRESKGAKSYHESCCRGGDICVLIISTHIPQYERCRAAVTVSLITSPFCRLLLVLRYVRGPTRPGSFVSLGSA